MASHALRRTRSPRTARTAVALVASTGLALTAVAAGAAAADSVPADASAGSLHGSGTAALASGAREVITTNKAVTVNADAAVSEDVTTASAVERTEDTVAVQKAAAEKKAAEEKAAAEREAAAEEAAQQEAQAAEADAATDTAQADGAEEVATAADLTSSESSSTATSSTTVSGSSVGAAIAATALQYQGVPYVSGGSTPSGWDCSGFVQWVYAQHGISLPRTSYAQGAAGTIVSAAQAQPGDIVYYGGHVGIYVGDGMMVDAGNTRVNTIYRAVYDSPQYVHVG